MMRKETGIIIILLVFFIILTSCNKKTNYQTEGPFLTVTSSPAGPDEYRNFFPRKYDVYEDGRLILYTESTDDIKIGEGAPEYEVDLSQEDMEKIKRVIEDDFWKLPEDVSDDNSVDGSFYYIAVHLTDSIKIIGGLNPNEPAFMEIVNYIIKLVEDESYLLWEEEMKKHIDKLNPSSF